MIEPFDFKENKQIKDATAANRAISGSILGGFMLPLSLLGTLLGFHLGGKVGGFVGLAGGILAGFLAVSVWRFLVDGISDNVGRMVFIGKKANWSLHERFQSDLQQIRYAKANERYGEALTMVNMVLKKAPKWPEPLFLKAEILWDGFESLEESKEILRQIIKLTEHPDQYHVWARAKYRELSQIRQESS